MKEYSFNAKTTLLPHFVIKYKFSLFMRQQDLKDCKF